MPSPELTRNGIALVSSAAAVSLTATTSLLGYIGVQCVRDARAHSAAPRRPGGLTFVRSDVGIMYLSLLGGDLLQAIGFVMSFRNVNDPAPSLSDRVCTAQGALIQSGDLCIALSTMLLALHTCFTVVRRERAPALVVRIIVPCIWLLVVLSTVLGPTLPRSAPFCASMCSRDSAENSPDVWLGFWCWVTPEEQLLRLLIHYLWVFVAAAVSLVCYGAVFWSLRTRDKFASSAQSTTDRIDKLAARLVLLPVVYILGIGTIAVNRIIQMNGGTTSPVVSIVGGVLFTLTGLADVILFSLSASPTVSMHILTEAARTAVPMPSLPSMRKLSTSLNMGSQRESVGTGSVSVGIRPTMPETRYTSYRSTHVELSPAKDGSVDDLGHMPAVKFHSVPLA